MQFRCRSGLLWRCRDRLRRRLRFWRDRRRSRSDHWLLLVDDGPGSGQGSAGRGDTGTRASRGRPDDHRSGRGPGRNGGRGRRDDDLRRLTRLWDYLARCGRCACDTRRGDVHPGLSRRWRSCRLGRWRRDDGSSHGAVRTRAPCRLWGRSADGPGGLTGLLLFLALLNGAQYVPWLGDVRQVDLWLLAVFRGPCGTAPGWFSSASQRGAHAYRFVVLHRTGVRLLFRNAHFREKIENDFTLYF